MKHFAIILFFPFAFFKVAAQTGDFEIKEWSTTSTDKPLFFYLSGDGGFNSFSTDLCVSLNRQGYQVIALNSKKYFWDKKTPAEATADVENYLSKKTAARKNKNVLMIGYSFGADVLPFLVNRFSRNISLGNVILMAPSGSTDFEIHWSDMFGGNKKRDMDVASEINKIVAAGLVLITGDDEDVFEGNRISLKNYTHETLPGGHHFDGNIPELTKTIMKYVH